MPNARPVRSAAKLFAVALALLLSAAGAGAQAIDTARKTLGISAFGGVTRVEPDYAQYADYGFILGGDITRHFHFADPSLEVRYSRATGTTVNESVFAGGLKLEKLIYRRFHPYADFLVGHGTIVFNFPQIFATGPYTQDDSTVYLFGGGLDYDVSENFAVKADYQGQAWNLGSNNSTLSPSAISVGVVYRIPFKGLRGRR